MPEKPPQPRSAPPLARRAPPPGPGRTRPRRVASRQALVPASRMRSRSKPPGLGHETGHRDGRALSGRRVQRLSRLEPLPQPGDLGPPEHLFGTAAADVGHQQADRDGAYVDGGHPAGLRARERRGLAGADRRAGSSSAPLAAHAGATVVAAPQTCHAAAESTPRLPPPDRGGLAVEPAGPSGQQGRGVGVQTRSLLRALRVRRYRPRAADPPLGPGQRGAACTRRRPRTGTAAGRRPPGPGALKRFTPPPASMVLMATVAVGQVR